MDSLFKDFYFYCIYSSSSSSSSIGIAIRPKANKETGRSSIGSIIRASAAATANKTLSLSQKAEQQQFPIDNRMQSAKLRVVAAARRLMLLSTRSFTFPFSPPYITLVTTRFSPPPPPTPSLIRFLY